MRTGCRALTSRRHRQDGYAVVTAVLVSLVVLTLSLTAFSLSAHNQDASAYDRERTRSVHAAEAGINDALATVLHAGEPANLPCSVTHDLTDGLTASYEVTIHYYALWPFDETAPLACDPELGVASAPGAVVIDATGSAGKVERRMETAARLSPAYGGAFDKAIFSHGGPTVGNNIVIDGDVYTNGQWICENATVVNGSLHAQGLADVRNTCEVKKDLWTGGTLRMRNKARVGRDAIAAGVDGVTGNSIVLANEVTIANRVLAAGTCSGCTPSRVNTDLVAENQTSLTAPPMELFPEFGWIVQHWVDAGFTVNNFATCADALTAIPALASDDKKDVVRIEDPGRCTLTFARNVEYSLSNDLAIVTDGSIEFVNDGVWHGALFPTLYLIVPYGTACVDGKGDITKKNGTKFVDLYYFAYTPCTATFENLNDSNSEGQVYGGTVHLANWFRLTGRSAFVPGTGLGELIGYSSEVAYIREIN